MWQQQLIPSQFTYKCIQLKQKTRRERKKHNQDELDEKDEDEKYTPNDWHKNNYRSIQWIFFSALLNGRRKYNEAHNLKTNNFIACFQQLQANETGIT